MIRDMKDPPMICVFFALLSTEAEGMPSSRKQVYSYHVPKCFARNTDVPISVVYKLISPFDAVALVSPFLPCLRAGSNVMAVI